MELIVVRESREIIWRKTIIYINQIEMDPTRECIIVEEHEFVLFIIERIHSTGREIYIHLHIDLPRPTKPYIHIIVLVARWPATDVILFGFWEPMVQKHPLLQPCHCAHHRCTKEVCMHYYWQSWMHFMFDVPTMLHLGRLHTKTNVRMYLMSCHAMYVCM